MSRKTPLHLRIFLCSPGDVMSERECAMRIIERLPADPSFRGRVTTETIAWDKRGIGAPMIATLTPQEAIDRKLPTPAECDIVVVILWLRMGTPLDATRYQKPDGTTYLSGTEWEYENAMEAAEKTGKPTVVIYRRTERVALESDTADFEQRASQIARVKEFFSRFINPDDGSMKKGYNTYKTPSEFELQFDADLRSIVTDLLAKHGEETHTGSAVIKQKSVFLSYNYRFDTDRELAWMIEKRLRQQGIEVYTDDHRVIEEFGRGTRWAEEVFTSIQKSTYFIVLLSKQSVDGEVVFMETRHAYEQQSVYGNPIIMPIRVRLRDEFPAHFVPYLNEVPWAEWNSNADTPRLLDELLVAVVSGTLGSTGRFQMKTVIRQEPESGFPRPQPVASSRVNFEHPKGTMPSHSRFYIKRQCDVVMQDQLEQGGTTTVVKAARQMGKSSLLIQVRHHAEELGKHFSYLDFQTLGHKSLNNEHLFFKNFSRWIAQSLNLDEPVDIDEYWRSNTSGVHLCTTFMERRLLPTLQGNPVVLAIDEVDRMIECEFRSDFFGMLRHWHNNRAHIPIWEGLDLVLSISTEPFLLIPDSNQSPFNVGEVIVLEDFTLEQVEELNQRHGNPLDQSELSLLFDIIGGHPYLVRQALYQVATGKISFHDLISTALEDSSPFADHLNQYLFKLSENAQLQEALQQIITGSGIPQRELVLRLRSAGLIRTTSSTLSPRNRLYAEYFRMHLVDVS